MVWLKAGLYIGACVAGGVGVAILVGATVGRRLLPSPPG